MKSILTKKVLFLALVAVTVFATGCIKEDLDECYKLRCFGSQALYLR